MYYRFHREAGVGFASSPPQIALHDVNRTELLKLLLTCFSEAMYLSPAGQFSFFASFFNMINITATLLLRIATELCALSQIIQGKCHVYTCEFETVPKSTGVVVA